jgi:hypothetical protein
MADTRDHVQRIHERGLLGFAEVVERQCAALLDLAESGAGATDPRWQEVLEARGSSSVLINALGDAMGGRMSPLAQLLLVFGLDRVETTLLMTLWGLATSEALARRAHALSLVWSAHLGADEHAAEAAGHTADLVARISFPDALSQQLALQALRPQATLRRYMLVRAVDSRRRDPRRERIQLDPDVAAALLGIWRPPHVARGAVRARDAQSLEERAVYSEHTGCLAALRRALAEHHVHLALIGRPGAGKRTLVRAAARAEQRPLIEVRLRHAPADPELLTELLLRCQRDALLRQAVLYIELVDDALPPALVQVFDADPGRLVIGVPAERPELATAAMRASWPDLGAVALPALDLQAQPALWEQLLRARGAASPSLSDLQAHACRPGLVIGDLVRAASAVLAPASRQGSPEAIALGAALSSAFARDLATLAEGLWLPGGEDAGQGTEGTQSTESAGLAGSWAAYAGEIRGGVLSISAWGVPEQQQYPRPVVAHTSGDMGRVVEQARALAVAVRMPLYRVDLGYLLASRAEDPAVYFERLFAAAARAGAVLLVTPIDALALDQPWTRAVTNALAAHLDTPRSPVLLHGSAQALPIALASRIHHHLAEPV